MIAAETLDQGLYFEIAEAVYHGDPAPEPSLSSSSAKVLLGRSPRAFAWAHPRLRATVTTRPAPPEEYDSKKAFGTCVHKLVLGRGKDVVIVDAAAWNTKAAKDERARILAHGHLPMLPGPMAEAEAIADEVGRLVDFRAGPTEVVLVWRDRATDGTPVWCRAMLDSLRDGLHIDDLKVTQAPLSLPFVGRQVGAMGYDFSASFYRRGLAKLFPERQGRIRNRLVFAERGEPFDVFTHTLSEGELGVTDRMVQGAIDLFAACMTAGRWPGVQAREAELNIKDFHLRDWLAGEMEDAA